MSHPTNELPDLPFAGQFSIDDLLLLRDTSNNTDYKMKVDTLISTLVSNAGNIESIEVDTIGNRPAAGTANRVFISTDEPRLYRDDGNSWNAIFNTAIGFDEGDQGGEIPSNDTRDARANTYSALQTFNASIQVDNISINGNTVSSTNTNGNINLSPAGSGVVKTNKINELTNGAGVTIESVLINDGNVDGVDVSALKGDVDGFPDELKNLTADEISQLENIGSTTISATQWGYVGSFDQGLSTSDDVVFNTISNTNLTLSGDFINDVNGNALLELGSNASAVNHIALSNSATGNAVDVELLGADTIISANYTAKGTGGFSYLNGNGTLLDILDSKIEAFKDLYIDSNIVHSGDTDTQIVPSADAWDVQTGGSSRLDINNNGIRLSGANARVDRILNSDDGGDDTKAVATVDFVRTIASGSGGGSGKIVQIAQKEFNTSDTSSSGSYVDISESSLSITPNTSTNTIYVVYSIASYANRSSGGNGSTHHYIKILRDGSDALGPTIVNTAIADTDYHNNYVGAIRAFVDSPATTSQVTYKLQQRTNGGGSIGVNVNGVSHVMLMEIAS